jgi:hypothetical protein
MEIMLFFFLNWKSCENLYFAMRNDCFHSTYISFVHLCTRDVKNQLLNVWDPHMSLIDIMVNLKKRMARDV